MEITNTKQINMDLADIRIALSDYIYNIKHIRIDKEDIHFDTSNFNLDNCDGLHAYIEIKV